MCINPNANVLIPPTDKAREYADYIRAVLGLLLLLSLCEFLGGTFISGIFDIIALLIGWLAIRNNEGYAFQQIMCFMLFLGLFGIWSLLNLFCYFTGVTTFSVAPSAIWQFYFYIAGLFAAPFIYSISASMSYRLYKEMKSVVDEMATSIGGMDQPFNRGGGYDVQQSAPTSRNDQQASSWRHTESHPTRPASNTANVPVAAAAPAPVSVPVASSASFQPFTGTGHKLGG